MELQIESTINPHNQQRTIINPLEVLKEYSNLGLPDSLVDYDLIEEWTMMALEMIMAPKGI